MAADLTEQSKTQEVGDSVDNEDSDDLNQVEDFVCGLLAEHNQQKPENQSRTAELFANLASHDTGIRTTARESLLQSAKTGDRETLRALAQAERSDGIVEKLQSGLIIRTVVGFLLDELREDSFERRLAARQILRELPNSPSLGRQLLNGLTDKDLDVKQACEQELRARFIDAIGADLSRKASALSPAKNRPFAQTRDKDWVNESEGGIEGYGSYLTELRCIDTLRKSVTDNARKHLTSADNALGGALSKFQPEQFRAIQNLNALAEELIVEAIDFTLRCKPAKNEPGTLSHKLLLRAGIEYGANKEKLPAAICEQFDRHIKMVGQDKSTLLLRQLSSQIRAQLRAYSPTCRDADDAAGRDQ